MGGHWEAGPGWTRLKGQPGLCLLLHVAHSVSNSPAQFWGLGQDGGIPALPAVLRATWVLPAACQRWAELLTWYREPRLDPRSPGCCKLPLPRHILGSAGYQDLGDRAQEHRGSPQCWHQLCLQSLLLTLGQCSLICPGQEQQAPHAPGLRGVDVLTQCGLLQSRQALTKNTFPVRRELPCHMLLFCFPLRAFLPQALPWSPSRVFPPALAFQAGCLRSDSVKQSWREVPGQSASARRVCKQRSVKEQQLLELGAARHSPGLGACLLGFPLPRLWCPAAAPVPGIASTAPLCSQERACSLPLRSDFAPWMHLWKNQLGHNALVCGSKGQGSLVRGGELGCSFPRRTMLPAHSCALVRERG